MTVYQLDRQLPVTGFLKPANLIDEFVTRTAHGCRADQIRVQVSLLRSDKHQVASMVLQISGVGRLVGSMSFEVTFQ